MPVGTASTAASAPRSESAPPALAGSGVGSARAGRSAAPSDRSSPPTARHAARASGTGPPARGRDRQRPGAFGLREHHPGDQVADQCRSPGDDREHDSRESNQRDIESEVTGDGGADAAEHAVAGIAQEWRPGGRDRGIAGRTAVIGGHAGDRAPAAARRPGAKVPGRQVPLGAGTQRSRTIGGPGDADATALALPGVTAGQPCSLDRPERHAGSTLAHSPSRTGW